MLKFSVTLGIEAGRQQTARAKIGGFLHLYIGREPHRRPCFALALAAPDDYVMTTYRDHGLAHLPAG